MLPSSSPPWKSEMRLSRRSGLLGRCRGAVEDPAGNEALIGVVGAGAPEGARADGAGIALVRGGGVARHEGVVHCRERGDGAGGPFSSASAAALARSAASASASAWASAARA